MSQFFITSSGTEIGKTFVTACLLYQCRVHHKNAMALKPIISGIEDGWDGSDTAILAQAMGRAPSKATLSTLSPFAFQAPLSPAMAAKLEGKVLDYDGVLAACRDALSSFDPCFIEGVGGSFVPMTDEKLVVDWIKDLGLESILVVGSYLGSQSHALATLEAMQARGLKVRAIVVSESAGEGHPDLAETARQLERHGQLPVRVIPRIEGSRPWERAPDLMDLIKSYPQA